MIEFNNISAYTSVYLGSQQITKVYGGEHQVWPTSTPQFTGKFKATYSDSTTYSAACDSNTTLTTATTKPSGYVASAMTSAEIGSCITSLGYAVFQNCSSLTSITIPSSVTSIGTQSFEGCTSLTSVTLPNNVTSIGNNVFPGCSSLISVNIPDSVTSIGQHLFYLCSSLTSVTIPSGVTSIGSNAFGFCSSLTSIDIPSSVTNIERYAFSYCTSVTSITINAVTPPTLGSGAFDSTNNCPIYVPCLSVEAYKTAWSAYADRIQCNQSTVKFKIRNNKTLQTAETDCDDSATLTRDEVNNVWRTIASGYAMNGNYDQVYIGDCVTTLEDHSLFTTTCNALTSLTLSDNITVIPTSCFSGCYALPSLTLPNALTTIGDYAFRNCESLTSITFPNTLTSIGNYAFEYAYSLTNLNIPDSVASIGNSAFGESSGLTSVTIGSGVTTIGTNAFQGCNSLTSITINAVTPPTTMAITAFDDTNNCPIYVPAGSVEAYKTALPRHANRIQAIPT